MNTEEKIYNIWFEPVLNAVIMEWNGYATSNQFREGTELMLNTLVRNKCNSVLADIKDMKIIGMDDQDWINNQFLPRAISFGFNAIAIIQPDHYFNKVAIESISYKVDKDKLAIKIFDNGDEAREWLKNFRGHH